MNIIVKKIGTLGKQSQGYFFIEATTYGAIANISCLAEIIPLLAESCEARRSSGTA